MRAGVAHPHLPGASVKDVPAVERPIRAAHGSVCGRPRHPHGAILGCNSKPKVMAALVSKLAKVLRTQLASYVTVNQGVWVQVLACIRIHPETRISIANTHCKVLTAGPCKPAIYAVSLPSDRTSFHTDCELTSHNPSLADHWRGGPDGHCHEPSPGHRTSAGALGAANPRKGPLRVADLRLGAADGAHDRGGACSVCCTRHQPPDRQWWHGRLGAEGATQRHEPLCRG